MSQRPPSLILPVTVTLAVLLATYVGAYYLTVQRGFSGTPLYTNARRYSDYDSFARTDTLRRRFFTPAHWLDRRIRPHVWGPGR